MNDLVEDITTALEVLTPEEKKTYTKCEKIIEKGMKHLLPMSEALITIREQRLYRIDYTSFESYCQSRWQMTRQYANRMIAAGETEKELQAKMETPVSTSIVKTENQAQRFRKLDDEEKEAVIEVLKIDSKNGEPNLAKALSQAEPENSQRDVPTRLERLTKLSGQVCVLLAKIDEDDRAEACEKIEEIAAWYRRYADGPLPTETVEQVMAEAA